MKKTVLLMAAAFCASVTFAQDLTSKKGEQILPEAGDWALGFDATPFLNYGGNLFNSNTNSAPTANFIDSGMTIYGKYFVEDQMAYRGSLRIGFSSATDRGIVADDAAVAGGDADATADDERTINNMDIVIGGGLEWRKGSTRLQGFYGGELMVMFSNASTSYTYANSFTENNTAPTFYDFSTGSVSSGGRITESKRGSTFGVGVRGFIGVEYFIFPKISVAAEYAWGLALQSTGESEVTVENINTAGTGAESTTTRTSPKSNAFGIDTSNNGGSLRMMFHF